MLSFGLSNHMGFGRLAWVALTCVALSWSGMLHAGASSQPNILWLVAEDLSPDLGCYGCAAVSTPHLDKLARQGMRYRAAFATSPVCAPSRSAFNTGMYQTTIGAHHQRLPESLVPALPDGIKVVSDWLREAGYFTGNIERVTERISGSGKRDWGFKYDGRPFDTSEWSELMERDPFYAQVNFSAVHRGGSWAKAWEDPRFRVDPADVVLPPYYPDHPVTRKDWARYLSAIQLLDYQVGAALKKLEKSGKADNTIVFFFSDHGRPMLRGKQWAYDSGLKVPLIIRWPDAMEPPAGFKRGQVSDALVSLIDVTATTLAVAGKEKPSRMQGRVLFGPERDPERKYVIGAADRDGECLLRSRTIRTDRYRYIENGYPKRAPIYSTAYRQANHPMYPLINKLAEEDRLNKAESQVVKPRGRVELYDVNADPYEVHDLSGSAAHDNVEKRLRRRLHAWMERTDDLGQEPDSPEIKRYFRRYGRRSAKQRADRIQELRREVNKADQAYQEWLSQ